MGEVKFSISEEKMESERIALVGVASKDARDKADMSLAYVGGSIDRIKLVQIRKKEEKSIYPGYFPNYGSRAAVGGMAEMAPTPIMAASEDLDVEVYVEFLLKSGL